MLQYELHELTISCMSMMGKPFLHKNALNVISDNNDVMVPETRCQI